ncbi:MAG: arylesterase [Proteobacteria bacterium]|nr:arylesterase [Pseudomonadota bacterium]
MIKILRQTFCLWLLLCLAACGDSTPQLERLSDNAVILAFGDSLTYGTGANKEESYPSVLENTINRKIINAGVPGELSMQGLKRLPKLLDRYQPGLMILCHGGNDILRKENLAEAETNIREMIALAKNKNIPVILLGVPKPGLFLSSAKLYANIAESTNVIFMPNLIADVLSDVSMKSDSVHPNKAGYREMAPSLAITLRNIGAI